MTVKIQFDLHTNQRVVWEDKHRFKVLVAGRRFGKTTLAVITLLVAALSKPGQSSLFWLVAPWYNMASH